LPGVSRGDESGNPFQCVLSYSGLPASPVPGTAQGIAGLQKGFGINQAYGDVGNWVLIRVMAMNRRTLAANDAMLGLNAIGGVGGTVATPVEPLNPRWPSVWTCPQITPLQPTFLTTSLTYTPTDTLSFQGNAYYRGPRASHLDGNRTEAQPCDPGGAFPGELC